MSKNRKFETTSKIPLKCYYSPPDLLGFDYSRNLGDPGQFPFTRGIRPDMYRRRLWTMRQYAGYATASESNHRFKYLLGLGQMGLSVAFDLPTQMGLDSSSPLASGEVGRVGVAIDTLRDMEILLEGIPLDQVSISMTINATAAILLAMVIAVARKQNVALEKLAGTVQNDILKEYIARGTYLFSSLPSMRLVTDVISFCSTHLPQWNPISISGYHIREAGSTAVQEVAFTLGNAIAYIQAALNVGLAVDAFAPRLSFFFNVHNHWLEEVAKFRAARRLWARIMKDRFDARNPSSWKLRFHAQTAGSTLTAQQPEVNVVRVALQALAAVLGGAQSLHTNARDEALSLPTAEAARLALRTQQVIAYESGVTDIVDPLAGSYALESLTDQVERKSQEYLDKIESMGGMLAAIASGYIQTEIQQSAYEYQKAIETRERIIVGVNDFVSGMEELGPIHRIDPSIEKDQIAFLEKVKSGRHPRSVEQSLNEVERIAASRQNLLPAIIKAVETYASVGEITERLRRVFGEYQQAPNA
jgi:methylmalonyl-CoA mutase N-terminal domain/subunit